MIQFECPGCGKRFSVSDDLAGRSAKCKTCGSPWRIPSAAPVMGERITIHFDDPPSPLAPSPSQAGRAEALPAKAVASQTKLPMRTRRLLADAEQVRRAFRQFPPIRIDSIEGDPPEKYRIEYNIGGLVRGSDGNPVPRERHVVEIQLTSEYPRQSPKCKMLTPIFHPNIEPAAICVGDHWTAGERLVDLIIRIGEMLVYQNYNIKSPLDGEAAMWVDQNARHLPTDSRDLHPPEAD